jgi:hypothetical protein
MISKLVKSHFLGPTRLVILQGIFGHLIQLGRRAR